MIFSAKRLTAVMGCTGHDAHCRYRLSRTRRCNRGRDASGSVDGHAMNRNQRRAEVAMSYAVTLLTAAALIMFCLTAVLIVGGVN